jgi:hypothetical protein
MFFVIWIYFNWSMAYFVPSSYMQDFEYSLRKYSSSSLNIIHSWVELGIYTVLLSNVGKRRSCTLKLNHYLYYWIKFHFMSKWMWSKIIKLDTFSHLGNAVGQCLTIGHCTNRSFWNLLESFIVKLGEPFF